MVVDLVIKNGVVVGPAKTLEQGWVAVEKGKIPAVGQTADPPESKEVMDVGGNYIIPGIIDPHTHPGVDRSFYHDIKSESKSAAAGGITTFLGTVKSTRRNRQFTKFATPSQVVSYHEVFPEAIDIINNYSLKTSLKFVPTKPQLSWWICRTTSSAKVVNSSRTIPPSMKQRNRR